MNKGAKKALLISSSMILGLFVGRKVDKDNQYLYALLGNMTGIVASEIIFEPKTKKE